MRVFLTGGAGNVGLPLVRHLVAASHSVKVTGRRENVKVPDAEYTSCDIRNYDDVIKAMTGCDMVIHLAAIPSPDKDAPQNLYQINSSGTFNVYQAAVDLGITRVVTASSINALGYFYGLKGFTLSYLPVDEDHPPFATDAYSFSKIHVEDIGRYFWHREGICGASLRIPGVYDYSEKRVRRFRENQAWARRYLQPKFAWSREEKVQWSAELEGKFQAFRDIRPFEWRADREHRWERAHDVMDEDETRLFYNKTNLFARLDARDCARAFELALSAPYDGFHEIFVNDAINGAGLPSADLAALVFPDASVRADQLEGKDSLVSIEKARSVLAFEPEFTII